MKSVIGNNIIISIFGESHSPVMGITINGFPAGVKIDYEGIEKELLRRKPDESISNARIEDDEFTIVSGVFNGYTTSTPLTVLVTNKNYNSSDYQKGLIRPSHADYGYYVRSKGFNDYRGGGFSSGRLTCLLVIAGFICKQILKSYNIVIGSHIKSIGNVNDNLNNDNFDNLFTDKKTVDEKSYEEMLSLIKKTKDEKDSLGGTIECFVKGIDAGIGEPFFDSIESCLSHYMFSIPGVKGITFGSCLDMAYGKGSQFNDQIIYNNDKVEFLSNHNGGINGGLSNGNIINFCVYFKPTPTIGLPQKTINIQTKENMDYEFKGRHDTCYATRCDVVVEDVCAICILDLLFSSKTH